MKLALRNRIAEWLLHAIERRGDGAEVRALIAFARLAGAGGAAAGLDEASSRVLCASELFVTESNGVRLRPDLAGDFDALRARAERFAAALEAIERATLPDHPRARAVAAAALLFEHRLFFEVHELLEPPWREANGDEREVLQGLIQVAVGFHHHEDGNLRGAISLLSDGNAKLFQHVPEALGIDLAALCRDVEAFAIQLRHLTAGDASAAIPPHPRWRSVECPP